MNTLIGRVSDGKSSEDGKSAVYHYPMFIHAAIPICLLMMAGNNNWIFAHNPNKIEEIRSLNIDMPTISILITFAYLVIEFVSIKEIT